MAEQSCPTVLNGCLRVIPPHSASDSRFPLPSRCFHSKSAEAFHTVAARNRTEPLPSFAAAPPRLALPTSPRVTITCLVVHTLTFCPLLHHHSAPQTVHLHAHRPLPPPQGCRAAHRSPWAHTSTAAYSPKTQIRPHHSSTQKPPASSNCP